MNSAVDAVRTGLEAAGVAFIAPEPDAFLLTLPGERRHRGRLLGRLLVGHHRLGHWLRGRYHEVRNWDWDWR